ncbi:MAG: hypothetical protein H6810_00095 [Phycisphaeraceae bacterium]|nr:MAG: hypothetical protein H6810_00095 [Phycisphaeraceae bacterium]
MPTPRWVELSPGLRVDRERRLLEFDGEVALDCHNPATPDAYLELIACSPDTREYESLIVTKVPPSLIHAGLLALGFEPGKPGAIRVVDDRIVRTPATGDTVTIEFVIERSGAERGESPLAWITDAGTRSLHLEGGWVFAGSRLVDFQGERVYDADGAGTVIGLTTFGGETIGFDRVISPESAIDVPEWIADPRTAPAVGTRVRVRLGPK